MKKIRMNDKAVAVPLAIVIVALIVIAGVAWFTIGSGGSKSYWETDTDFGMWQDEVILEFKDGTTQSLKLINENQAMKVMVGVQEIVGARYRITATVSGTGYEGATLTTDNYFGVKKTITKSSTVKYSNTFSIPNNQQFNVPIGDSYVMVDTNIDLDSIINDHPSEYPTGLYALTFVNQGTFYYKGYPSGGDWEEVPLPTNRILSLIVTQGSAGSITVTLGSSVDY